MTIPYTPLAAIEAEATEELRQEAHRAAVEAAKERIRARRGRPWWRRLFPYTIKIIRS